MRKQKYYLAIDDYERSVIINSCPPDFCLEKQRKHRGHSEKTVICCSYASIVRKNHYLHFYEILLTSRNDKSIM
jgi:hypothetical protein